MTKENTKTAPNKLNKTATLLELLKSSKGVKIDDLADILKWRKNSIRGAMTNLAKKVAGKITCAKQDDGQRYYHIEMPKAD